MAPCKQNRNFRGCDELGRKNHHWHFCLAVCIGTFCSIQIGTGSYSTSLLGNRSKQKYIFSYSDLWSWTIRRGTTLTDKDEQCPYLNSPNLSACEEAEAKLHVGRCTRNTPYIRTGKRKLHCEEAEAKLHYYKKKENYTENLKLKPRIFGI